ncbi:hypothetical protein, partial [Klebsiella michiganensis]|uniref:hypothetical protein n=1 Tax=Klebsiella michiganensis TaxID=1134687 RepID=UPI001CC9EA6A
ISHLLTCSFMKFKFHYCVCFIFYSKFEGRQKASSPRYAFCRRVTVALNARRRQELRMHRWRHPGNTIENRQLS